MDDIKKQIVERVQSANNVLVTVSSNPTVDQLAAAIGMTLMLNKLGKHATAVFSGEVPSVLEFLQPEKTIEKNTDSLRDFIIALDKAKADKLRYKVEDSHVKIFITPYRSSISEADLEFSQGDFNVEVVIALGVTDQKDLDAAITAHGRILHDATVMAINTHAGGQLGTINLIQDKTSSLCEVAAELAEQLKPGGLDEQMATAFLTGIVAETERFSNEKTSAITMGVSGRLMTAGANQQLIATKLEEPEPEPEPLPEPQPVAEPEPASEPSEEQPPAGPPAPEPEEATDEPAAADTPAPVEEKIPEAKEPKPEESPEAPQEAEEESKTTTDGTLEIDHGDSEEHPNQIDIDDQGNLHRLEDEKAAKSSSPPSSSSSAKFVTDPPISGGTLTANSRPEALDPLTDPLSLPPIGGPMLSHDSSDASGLGDTTGTAGAPAVPDPLFSTDAKPEETLSDIEKSLASPHVTNSDAYQDDGAPKLDADDARDAIDQAMQAAPDSQPLPPIAALHAQPADLDFGHTVTDDSSAIVPAVDNTVSDDSGLPSNVSNKYAVADDAVADDSASSDSGDDSTAPPPVPPPMMPPLPADDKSSDKK